MAFKQPRVPQMKEGSQLPGFIRELVLFLKDFCMESWTESKRQGDSIETLKKGQLDTPTKAEDASKLDGKTWAELLLEIYPVGSTYLSTNDTSPASLFGGTWEQLKDRFLLGAGDSYTAGNTGGEATVKLTTGQLPAIRGQIHAGSGSSGTSGKGYGAFRAASGVFSAATEMQYGRPSESTSITWPSSVASYQYVNLSVGNGESHNNMPPYLAVYMWKRVS